MKPKLVLNIVKLPTSSLAIQVAEQDEELRNKNTATPLILCPSSENRLQVNSGYVLTALYDKLCVLGIIRDHDLCWDHINFKSAEGRDEWLRKLQNSLDYINGIGEKEVAAPLEIEVLKMSGRIICPKCGEGFAKPLEWIASDLDEKSIESRCGVFTIRTYLITALPFRVEFALYALGEDCGTFTTQEAAITEAERLNQEAK